MKDTPRRRRRTSCTIDYPLPEIINSWLEEKKNEMKTTTIEGFILKQTLPDDVIVDR